MHCLVTEFDEPGICAPAHYRKYIEILYGTDCDITVWMGDKFKKFKSGDLCYIGSGELSLTTEKTERVMQIKIENKNSPLCL